MPDTHTWWWVDSFAGWQKAIGQWTWNSGAWVPHVEQYNCDGGGTWRHGYSTTHGTCTGITVSPSTATVARGDTQQFFCVAHDVDGWTWNVTADTWGVDTFTDSIDGTGLFTAGSIPSTPTVLANYGIFTGSASVTVP